MSQRISLSSLQNGKKGRQRRTNLINVEPRIYDTLLVTNINIVTRGGKKTGEDRGMVDPPLIVKVVSTKKSYKAMQKKQYYQEATKLFEGMTETKEKQK